MIYKSKRIAIVMVHPLIHWNTGAAGRTCLGFDFELHIIKPIGFKLDDKHLKRAGLDYWSQVDLRIHESWDSFYQTELLANFQHVVLFSKISKRGVMT